MNSALSKNPSQNKIKELEMRWRNIFYRLCTQLNCLIAEDLSKIKKKRDENAICHLYKALHDTAPDFSDLNKEQKANLQSIFQSFLSHYLQDNYTQKKQPLCYSTRKILEHYQIEGILYNALVTHIQLCSPNTLEGKTITLSNHAFKKDNFPLSNIQNLQAIRLPQDKLRALYFLDQSSALQLKTDFLITHNNASNQIFITNKLQARLFRTFREDLLGTIQYFSYQNLPFYIQLINKDYSIDAIAVLSDFLLSNTPEVFQKESKVRLEIINKYNVYYSFSKLKEVYDIALATDYPLDASNALRLAALVSPKPESSKASQKSKQLMRNTLQNQRDAYKKLSKKHKKRLTRLLAISELSQLLKQNHWDTLESLTSQVEEKGTDQALSNIETFYGLSDQAKKLPNSQLEHSHQLFKALCKISCKDILEIETKQCQQLISENQRFQEWIKKLNVTSNKKKPSSKALILKKQIKKIGHEQLTIFDLIKACPKAPDESLKDNLKTIAAALNVLKSESTCTSILEEKSSWGSEVEQRLRLEPRNLYSLKAANPPQSDHQAANTAKSVSQKPPIQKTKKDGKHSSSFWSTLFQGASHEKRHTSKQSGSLGKGHRHEHKH